MEENDEKIRIERILGLSVSSNAHFASDSGIVAYPAGNTVVLLDIGSGTVVSHAVLESRKPISSLQLKNSHLFVASEDSNSIRVINWQSGIQKDISPCQNVICSAVSPLLGILITVGSDRVVNVWDYKSLVGSNERNGSTPTQQSGRARKLASSSVACKVTCVAFSPDGHYFVTGGSRHLKFWYLQLGKNECVLTGRPAILGSEHSSADFKDIITDGTATYAIANFDGGESATLCQFDERRFLDKWVQLKTKEAFCLAMDGDLLFIGCADGLIRCFRTGKLDFVATLPLPHHLGVDIAKATDVTALSSHPPVSKFPNVVAIGAPGRKKIVSIYADHSLYAWDVQDIKRVGLSHSWLWHSGCIWDVSVGSSNGFLNWPSFLTCSNDDTIRIWDITSQTKSNLYSNECIDIKYISTRFLDSPLFLSHGNGVRCVGVGSTFVCCGDRQGNLRLSRSKTKNELIKIKAHKEEVLSMDVKGTLIATASRDGSVNLYNIGAEIERISSLQEHSGSVTSVKFLYLERTTPSTLLVISCGADKNLIFRQIVSKKDDLNGTLNYLNLFQDGDYIDDIEIHVLSVVSSKTPLFDLEVDASGKHVLVACQDACVRVFNVSSGKHSKTLRNPACQGTFIKVTIDPSGYYVAVASTDKTITVFDYYKGEVVATLMGHSELATALRFTPDFQNLLSVGGDSCIFVWSLPREMVVTMEARMGEKRSRQKTPLPAPLPTPSPVNPPSPVKPSDYRFSFGQLPDWAKKQMKGGGESSGPPIPPAKKVPNFPQGKWNERIEQASGAMVIKSYHNTDTVVQVPFTKTASTNNLDTIGIKETPMEISPTLPIPIQILTKDDKDSGENSFEANEESLNEITRHEDIEGESTDFYSDVNKSTDGEASEDLKIRNNLLNNNLKKLSRSDTDTDDSSSARRNGRSFGFGAADPHPFDVVRSRNAELIMSVKLKNKEISKSRLELEKRLEDTRKKLQSIGYKSMSQSTHDLSRTFGNKAYPYPLSAFLLNGEKGEMMRNRVDGWNHLSILHEGSPSSILSPSPTNAFNNLANHFNSSRPSTAPTKHRTNKVVQPVLPSRVSTYGEFLDDSDDDEEEEGDAGGIRRACSLSDLNIPPTPTNSTPNTSAAYRRKRSFHKHRNEKSRTGTTGVFDAQNLLTRSTSVSALMNQVQSDSEPESLPSAPSYMSQTKASQGKTRRKPSNVTLAYSQENLRDAEDSKLRVSASEQNLTKVGTSSSKGTHRNKMNTPLVKKPQQVHGITKGMAVVTGVRHGDEPPLSVAVASNGVEALRKSLEQVINLRNRVSAEDIPDEIQISRILDEGLLAAQRTIQESVIFQDVRPKIITDTDPTVL